MFIVITTFQFLTLLGFRTEASDWLVDSRSLDHQDIERGFGRSFHEQQNQTQSKISANLNSL